MKAILAMDPHRVIGNKGRIPWYLPDDFKWFKSITMGGNLLMGRSTFESIGKPLPGRFTYILTSDIYKRLLPFAENCGYVDAEWIMAHSYKFQRDLWVCGGAKVYKKFLPLCDSVYVTHVMEDYEGDTYMPEFESMFPESEIILENKDFWVVRYHQ